MSERCHFATQTPAQLKDGYFAYIACLVGATEHFGEISVCHVHAAMLRNNLEKAISWANSRRLELGDNQWYSCAKRTIQLMEIEEREHAKAERKAERLATSINVVYFMERHDFVKIGFTTSIRKRLAAVSKGSCLIEGMTVGPVRLLATVPGDTSNERYFHRKFAAKRIGGEWFVLDDELWTFITSLKGYTGEPRRGLPALPGPLVMT